MLWALELIRPARDGLALLLVAGPELTPVIQGTSPESPKRFARREPLQRVADFVVRRLRHSILLIPRRISSAYGCPDPFPFCFPFSGAITQGKSIILISDVADCPSQVTVTLPVPVFVVLPIFQVHVTFPSASVFSSCKPDAWLTTPEGV